MKLTLILLAALYAQAQDIPPRGTNGAGAGDVRNAPSQAAPNVAKPEPPKITDQEQLAWMQARAESAEATLAKIEKDRALAEVIQGLQQKCPLTLNPQTRRAECAPQAARVGVEAY